MASLDKLEGELVEGAGLLVLVLLVILIFRNRGANNQPGGILGGLTALLSSGLNWVNTALLGGSSNPWPGPYDLPDVSGGDTGGDYMPTSANGADNNELAQLDLQQQGYVPPTAIIAVPAGSPLNQAVVSNDPTDSILTTLGLSGMPVPF